MCFYQNVISNINLLIFSLVRFTEVDKRKKKRNVRRCGCEFLICEAVAVEVLVVVVGLGFRLLTKKLSDQSLI